MILIIHSSPDFELLKLLTLHITSIYTMPFPRIIQAARIVFHPFKMKGLSWPGSLTIYMWAFNTWLVSQLEHDTRKLTRQNWEHLASLQNEIDELKRVK
jgi:hypothetical protein